jgi:hypothetical protein
METALDALPGRPMSAEDIAALNNAATLRLIPYTWLGEQVMAALLLYDERRAEDDQEVGADARVTDTDADEEEEGNPFGGRDDSIGTVEVIGGDDSEPEPAAERVESDADDDLRVYAVGYDDGDAAWVVISEINPDAEFTDAEPPIREWAAETYHEAIVDRLAIGPSEYELAE